MRGGVVRDQSEVVLLGGGAGQVAADPLQTALDSVDVRVDEPRSHQATCTVDDTGPGRDVRLPDRHDAPAVHDDRPTGWVVPVAVEQGGATKAVTITRV